MSLALAAAVLAAVLIAGWAYAWREETVAGRVGPAVLRGLALASILGGWFLPPIFSPTPELPERVVLLDTSASMQLPVAPGRTASRFDSALAEVRAYGPERVYAFGGQVRAVPADSLDALSAEQPSSGLGQAVQAARLGGADSVVLVTDGELDDRVSALALAERLGLGIREMRVGRSPTRITLGALEMPERVRAGDTVRAVVRLTATADTTASSALPDSVLARLLLDGREIATRRLPVPTPGRTGVADMSFVPDAPDDAAEWRRYRVVLDDEADPLDAAREVGAWIEVSDAAGGAVLLSTEPDWESRFLLPGLDRMVLGGVRGFLALSDQRYLEMGANPRLVGDPSRLPAILRRARLLVVQADPASLPDWLGPVLRTHPRKLVFPRGPGAFPGVSARLSGPLPGEWYAVTPVPPGPAAPLIPESALGELPPLREVYGIDGDTRWTILNGSQNRRGQARPFLVAHQVGDARWALAGAAEWWRWANREGPARAVYEGMLSGVIAWLLEDAQPRLVTLAEAPRAGRPLEWRVRSSVDSLNITLTEAGGDTVWTRDWAEPGSRVSGPVARAGLHRIHITARGAEGAFEDMQPIELDPARGEWTARPTPSRASVAPVVRERRRAETRAGRPVWPFVLAIVLLCAEWVWRHRIGLR